MRMRRFEVEAIVKFVVFGDDTFDAADAVISTLESHDIAHISHVTGYELRHVRQLEGEGE